MSELERQAREMMAHRRRMDIAKRLVRSLLRRRGETYYTETGTELIVVRGRKR